MDLARFLPVVFAALLAAGVYWLAEQARRSEPARPVSPRNPDIVVEGVRMSRMNAQGTVQTILNATRMTHVPQSDAASFEQPRILQNAPGRPAVTITAARAESRNNAETVDLAGDVVITREATATAPALVVRTPALQVRPDDETATTDREVEIVHGASTMQGLGLRFSNADRSLDIEHHARGVIAPPQRR